MASETKLKITYRDTSTLTPYGNNARTHSKTQIKQVAESIKTFGWTNPILIDKDLTVLAGHGRLAAANELGISKVPTILMAQLTEAEKKAYILADNKLAENASWDKELVALEIGAIAELDIDFNFEVTGFTAPEIDWMLHANDDNDAEDDPFPVSDAPPVTRPGDLWLLGPHRLYCGDARNAASYKAALGDQQAAMIFTDPPYNVPIDGFASGNGTARHSDFAMACGEMSEDEFEKFLQTVMTHMATFSKDNALHYICMDWRHAYELISAARSVYTKQENLCVWNKSNAGMGSFYRSKHELVFIYKTGSGKAINNIELGKHGRHRTNVWDYAGANGFSKTRNEDLAAHPTVKPTTLVADAILDASHQGDVILDPFCGAGTTILAAEQTKRHATAIEIDPAYVDVAICRYEAASGAKAIHAGDKASFEELRKARTDWTYHSKEAQS